MPRWGCGRRVRKEERGREGEGEREREREREREVASVHSSLSSSGWGQSNVRWGQSNVRRLRGRRLLRDDRHSRIVSARYESTHSRNARTARRNQRQESAFL
eukprot:132579-Rhodomonas_salina.1